MPFCQGFKLEELSNGEKNDKDVILLCRQYVGSDSLCQPPVVFGTSHMFQSLMEKPTNIVPRAAFSARQLKEFEKTATTVSQSPWLLDAATAYILKLIEDNRDGHSDSWVAPDVGFGLSFAGRGPEAPAPSARPDAVPAEALGFANRAPAPGKVKLRKKHGRKQTDLKSLRKLQLNQNFQMPRTCLTLI